MIWSEFLLFLLNWDWFDLIRAIYSSVSCPNFCCHSCTTLIKVEWIRVGKISKHKVYNMKELRKSKKWHETLKCSNQFKKTQNQLKQIESWSGYFFLPTKPCLAPSESSGIMLGEVGNELKLLLLFLNIVVLKKVMKHCRMSKKNLSHFNWGMIQKDSFTLS